MDQNSVKEEEKEIQGNEVFSFNIWLLLIFSFSIEKYNI
jgi:hypothetical protein